MVLGGGESKTLAWGFAMAPHRLRALVKIFVLSIFEWPFNTSITEDLDKGISRSILICLNKQDYIFKKLCTQCSEQWLILHTP